MVVCRMLIEFKMWAKSCKLAAKDLILHINSQNLLTIQAHYQKYIEENKGAFSIPALYESSRY